MRVIRRASCYVGIGARDAQTNRTRSSAPARRWGGKRYSCVEQNAPGWVCTERHAMIRDVIHESILVMHAFINPGSMSMAAVGRPVTRDVVSGIGTSHSMMGRYSQLAVQKKALGIRSGNNSGVLHHMLHGPFIGAPIIASRHLDHSEGEGFWEDSVENIALRRDLKEKKLFTTENQA